jgi:hypothetical protein
MARTKTGPSAGVDRPRARLARPADDLNWPRDLLRLPYGIVAPIRRRRCKDGPLPSYMSAFRKPGPAPGALPAAQLVQPAHRDAYAARCGQPLPKSIRQPPASKSRHIGDKTTSRSCGLLSYLLTVHYQAAPSQRNRPLINEKGTLPPVGDGGR